MQNLFFIFIYILFHIYLNKNIFVVLVNNNAVVACCYHGKLF